ncbi:hypothetical protein JOQ06_015056 [Pogonophryne albipinna]|uniref:Uncharacterized protein n=1 Tax=Pogonophryne albipinna TaxID=1090488 RepID=A0AAD6AM78_9TELE|nr:hypothetical protein JOQ06_015056 [Pogonophryne albipinna]
MMQESGTEATNNGLANQNGGASLEGGAKSATPSVEVTAADLLHLQQHQEAKQRLQLIENLAERITSVL